MSYAKTLPPELPHVFERTRLFDVLDQYRDRRAIWVQGQAGAGKTTLIASYLKKRDLQALWYRIDASDTDPATFFHYLSLAAGNLLPARHRPLPQLAPESLTKLAPFGALYFRELFQGLSKPLLLVFDNIHILSANSPLLETLTVLLGEIPREMQAILISRSPPFASLSRLQLNRTLALVNQDTLRLTDEEVSGLARLWLPGEIEAETIQQMNERVDGWAAGLVLLLESGSYDISSSAIGNEYFFHYFASEIFDTMSGEMQRFLLQTACLDTMALPVVRELTGISETREILEDLCERHYFTSRSDQNEPVYQYHPLFRDFLLHRGRNDLGRQGYRQITARAARILATAGQTEEAIDLAITATDWPFACTVVNQLAPVMLAQQRIQSLEQWLQRLPQEVFDVSPWLYYWYGCCRRPFDQHASCGYFALAYSGFQKHLSQDGMLFSASGAILSIITEWDDFKPLDRWIAVLQGMANTLQVNPSANQEAMMVLAMLGALLFHKPHYRTMVHWESRAHELLRDNGVDISLRIDIGNMLVHYQYWKGDLAAAAYSTDFLTQLVEVDGSATLPRLSSIMNHAIHDWHTADFDHCLNRIDQGLILSAEMGIHIMDDRLMAQSVYASLARDDLPSARQFLDRMQRVLQNGRRLSMSHYHYLSGNYFFVAGDLEMARQHTSIAVDINREVGAPYPEALADITLAQINFELDEQVAATTLLAEARALAGTMRSRTLELLVELASAWFTLATQETAALSHLHRGLTLQRQTGFLHIPGWCSRAMKPLLLKALENDIEPEFVRQLIRAHNLHTKAPPQANESWPWPIKIYTLGRFCLLIDDKSLQFTGKAQQKPLELLKVLISCGGREVGKNKLIDHLWPDTDGDKAMRALDTTLHRLRKLVGYEQIVQVQGRKLSLNNQLCWLDIWAMEYLIGQTETFAGQTVWEDGQAATLQQLLSLYQGDFLTNDDEPDCLISCRDRLHNRFLNRLVLLGDQLEKQAGWSQAEALYQRLLEIDARQELIYQRLLICYQKQGRIAEAIAIYERCRKALTTHFGISPSTETETCFRNLR